MQVVSKPSRPAAFLLSVAALAALAAPARADEPGPALKAVQGTWTTRDDAEVSAKWTIKGDAIKVLVNGVEYAGKVTIDAEAKPHPAFTIDIKEGPGEVVGKSAKGVYKVDGDKLDVNIAAPGNDRPVDFNPFGSDIYLFELTRKPDAK
ncbi:MAG: hypothetical protein BGO49_00085 [Planctomycetales bacterium 71-10]|nr:MAG: hypothetical protein BGO49_00085 [Planctomycetales bacterium 71-10]